VEELGLPELTNEQIEEVCATAEDAARKHILSRVKSKMIESLNITVEVEGERPLSLTVEVDISPLSKLKQPNLEKIANEAVQKAIEASEEHMRKLK
jgi:hypothetical protein